MDTTHEVPHGLLAFRRRAISVTAGVLAVGMLLLGAVLELTNPGIVAVDVLLLVAAAAVHGAAAVTVGRRWRPGGVVCLAYLVVITLLISASFVHADTPQSDAFWFLLVPVGLSAVTMPARLHAAVTALGIAMWPVMTSFGPGIDVPLTVSRSVSMALFGVAIHAFTGRLEQALVDADEARSALADQLAEVQRLNEELRVLDRAKDDFVSSVSHELRTPLTVIQGLTGTLDAHWDDIDPPRRRSMARRIGANARGLAGIVATLLDLARIERGGLAPVPDDVPLRAAVEESLVRLGPVLEDHPVDVEVPEDLVVRADPRLLERVLDNLLSNAARHTGAGTAVEVRARLRDTAVRTEVVDAGPGLQPDEVARLGEQFYRAGDTTAAPGVDEGTGLGLSLVGDVLAAMDSHLEVTSQPGHGTTFRFDLPAAAVPPQREVASSGQARPQLP